MIRHMDRTLNSQVASTTDTVKVFMLLQCKSKHGRELFPSTTARSDSDIRWAILTKIKMALPQIFHIYTGPKLTQIPDLHGTQIYTNLDLHRTHIYTAQIYTNSCPHIYFKKPKFTQPKFTQNPNLHNPNLHKTQNLGTIVARGSRTRGSSTAYGSLRPFGPVSGSNVARGSSVLYLTRGR